MTANPALAQLHLLVGAWDMELFEASFLPDPHATVRGLVTFEFEAEVSVGHSEIIGQWEKSVDGGTTWEHDFRVRYVRN